MSQLLTAKSRALNSQNYLGTRISGDTVQV